MYLMLQNMCKINFIYPIVEMLKENGEKLS